MLDLPAATVAWISFNVNGFEWLLKVGIPERYIPDTVMLRIGRHTTNRQSHTQPNRNILNEHMLSTVTDCPTMTWFRNNYIIIVLHSEIPDMEVLTCWIDSISIEGE